MLIVYHTTLVLLNRADSVDFSELSNLASGRNLNLTSDGMEDIRRQRISIGDENETAP